MKKETNIKSIFCKIIVISLLTLVSCNHSKFNDDDIIITYYNNGTIKTIDKKDRKNNEIEVRYYFDSLGNLIERIKYKYNSELIVSYFIDGKVQSITELKKCPLLSIEYDSTNYYINDIVENQYIIGKDSSLVPYGKIINYHESGIVEEIGECRCGYKLIFEQEKNISEIEFIEITKPIRIGKWLFFNNEGKLNQQIEYDSLGNIISEIKMW
jgi:hypothetical protein